MSMDVTRTDLSERVAEEILAWMGRRRLSGAALARTLGVSTAWVSYRLNGKQPIDLNDLQRIAAVLNVEPVDLMPRQNEGRVVATSGSSGRQTTTPKNSVANRPSLFGQPKHGTPKSSTRRPVFV